MSTRILAMPALVSLLALAACAPPPPPTTGTSDDEVAIRAIGTRFAEAWNKGDVAGMTAMTADDYEAVAADGTVIKGKAADEEVTKKGVADRAGMNLKLNIQTTYVHWAGSAKAASVGGTWTLDGLPPGAGGDKGAWMILVMKGADNQWRSATGLVAEFVPPPAAPAAPAAADKGKGKGK